MLEDSSGSFTELIIIVSENVPVTHLIIMNTLDCLAATLGAKGNGLDPSLDFLCSRKIEHGNHLVPAAEV